MTKTPKDKAKIIKPSNRLSLKVGKGGLPKKILNQAEKIQNDFSFDFMPMAYSELVTFKTQLKELSSREDSSLSDAAKDALMTPIMMIKANAGMFHYDLLREVAEDILYTLDYIDSLNTDALDLIDLQVRILNHIIDHARPGKITPNGLELIKEIDSAIDRYRKKHPQSTPDVP